VVAGSHHGITDQELKRKGTLRDCPEKCTDVLGLGFIKIGF